MQKVRGLRCVSFWSYVEIMLAGHIFMKADILRQNSRAWSGSLNEKQFTIFFLLAIYLTLYFFFLSFRYFRFFPGSLFTAKNQSLHLLSSFF
jgi:hypothetical protein